MQLDRTQRVYTPDAGEHDDDEVIYCGVCGNKMEVDRNSNGATSWMEAMSKKSHLHDYYWCPDKDEVWHHHVLDLQLEQKNTKSPSIAALIEQDIRSQLSSVGKDSQKNG